MSDSNQDQERNPRFSRALLGRILAVGLFVILGTFAVIHLMKTTGQAPSTESLAAVGTAGVEAAAGNNASPTSGVNGGLANGLPALSANASLSQSSLSQSPLYKPAQIPPSAPPPRDGLAGTPNPVTNRSSFQPTPLPTGNPGALQSFEPVKPPTMMGNQSNGPSPNLNPIPATQNPNGNVPLERFAQLPNSRPVGGGADNGFNSLPMPPPANPPNLANGMAAKTQQAANDLGNRLANTTNQLRDDAQQNGTELVNGFNNQVPKINSQIPPVTSNAPQNNNLLGNNLPNKLDPFASPVLKLPNPVAPPTQLQPVPGVNDPALKAPVPNQGGFDPAGNSRPASNRLDVNNAATAVPKPAPNHFANPNPNHPTPSPSNLPPVSPGGFQNTPPVQPAPGQDNNRLNGINQFGNGPTVQPKTEPGSGIAVRPQIPSQSVSTPLNSARPEPNLAAAARTTNVPGDRQLDGVQAPAVTVEKLSPREIQVNQLADFEIVVRNVGRVNAEDVQVHDQIPAGTEFQGAAPEPTSLTPDRKIFWSIGSLKSGQEKRIKFQLKPVQPGEIGSVAHVTFATQASMRTLVTKPVLEITHQTKPSVLIGSDVILDVVVTNRGDGVARNVLIQEDVPKQLEYQGGYRELEYPIDTLMPGQSKRIKLSLKAAEIGRTKNLIFASAEGGLRAQHEIELEVVAPRLVTANDGPTRRYLQREATHQFKVGNQGTAPATNVDLVASLPAGLRFISANNQGVYKPSAHAVVWSIAELGMNVDAAVELVTMPVEAGNQNIKFEAIADLNQKSAVEQELNVEHLVDVFFDIDDMVDPIEIGAITSYQVRVVNQGTQAAANVQLQIEFPEGLVPTAVEGSLQNQIQGQRIQFAPITSMKPGDQLQLVVRAKGQTAGDHRVVVVMQADGRQTPVAKEESTRVYADR